MNDAAGFVHRLRCKYHWNSLLHQPIYHPTILSPNTASILISHEFLLLTPPQQTPSP